MYAVMKPKNVKKTVHFDHQDILTQYVGGI